MRGLLIYGLGPMGQVLRTPGAIRFIYETMRYSMAARGLRFETAKQPPESVVDALFYLEGRRLYEKGHHEPSKEVPLAVFIHGLGSSVATWSSVLPAIARRVPLVAPDLPGFGRTPLPKDAPFATFREHVDSIHNFLDEVSPDAPVQLIGQSLGGWIAARVAAERPQRVARLTLSNAAGIHHPQVLEQRRLFSPRDKKELQELWMRMWHRLPMTFHLFKRQYLELTRTPVVRGFMDTVVEKDFLEPEDLARIDAPTLLVWGLADRLIDYEFAAAYRKGIRDVRFRPIPECGHVPQREDPRMFLRYVLPWIQGHEPPETKRPGVEAAATEAGAPARKRFAFRRRRSAKSM